MNEKKAAKCGMVSGFRRYEDRMARDRGYADQILSSTHSISDEGRGRGDSSCQATSNSDVRGKQV